MYNVNCARCRLPILEGKELGGTYDGVICKNHRSCEKCWFGKDYHYGRRASEVFHSRSKPLTEKPLFDCFGCHFGAPYHEKARKTHEDYVQAQTAMKTAGYLDICSDSD